MGKRLSKIYTRTGDDGETGLGNGERISKNHPRVEAMGHVDEFNSVLGVLIEEMVSQQDGVFSPVIELLRASQHRIFDLGGELSIPGHKIIDERHIEAIEHALDELNRGLEPLENFILPGGSRLVATCHWARSVCRRAERSLVDLSAIEDINGAGLKFLNRLSDYLFVVARWAGKQQRITEVLWEKD